MCMTLLCFYSHLRDSTSYFLNYLCEYYFQTQIDFKRLLTIADCLYKDCLKENSRKKNLVNGFWPWPIIAKHSIIDVSHNPKHIFDIHHENYTQDKAIFQNRF